MLFAFSLLAKVSLSQEARIVTLKMLHKGLEDNSPISSIKPELEAITNLQLMNVSTTFLPKIDFNASATWQSEVTSIEIPFPGVSITPPDKDQYRLTLDISQVIWDGGATKARKELTTAQHRSDLNSLNIEIYGIRDKLNEFFFAVAAIDISYMQIEIMRSELIARLGSLQSGVREGVILQSAPLNLKAEILRLEQSLIELSAKKQSLVSSLRYLTGLNLFVDDIFVLPDYSENNKDETVRLEIEGFTFQKYMLDSRSILASKKRMPTLAGFVASGYGKPGLNMLSDTWNPYLMVGARLSWNIWDWNFTKREREQINVQKSIIDLRQKAFEDGLGSAVETVENQIKVIDQQLAIDLKLIELKEEIKRKSESQFLNGLISSTEYLADFNAAAKAKLDMEHRRVLLSKEKAKLYFLLGYDIE